MKTFITGLILSFALTTASYANCGEGEVSHSSGQTSGTIVTVAKEAGTFKTLLAAAEAAGLADTLSSGGPFTVFAPTDEAFSKLPEGTLESLLADKEKLSQILLYHVVPGRIEASEVVKASSLKSAQGEDVQFKVDETGVKINGASIIATDIEAGNGIIHVIESVILPPASSASR